MNNYKKSRKEIAKFLNINLRDLTYVLYGKQDNSYKVFNIPKKNGGSREICSPSSNLKRIQKKLGNKLSEIYLNYLKENNLNNIVSHGFQKEKNIVTNACIHRNKRYLLNVDIENFFTSFNFGRVQGYFYKDKKFDFSKECSTIIAQLSCYNGVLPQGSPSSPVITNLIFNMVDLKIIKLAKKYKLDYTRYADDLSFSTNKKSFQEECLNFIEELTELLFKNGFSVNKNKTRLLYYSSCQEVTGLTVNEKVNAKKSFIKKTRAMANHLYKYGSFKLDGIIGTLNQLEGRFAFINIMDRWNSERENIALDITNKKERKYKFGLNSREREYQYFLFYKYFFNPTKPTIITEGKTDAVHIKVALMKYHANYPNLIEEVDGKFKFKVYFLRKTSRLEYFFGISKTGADSIQNIWHFYNGSNGHKNIFEYLNCKLAIKEQQKYAPVILLYDNEQHTTGKPLRKFLTTLEKKNIIINKDDISLHLKSNLYLQLIPKIPGKDECEIEDLYDLHVLNTKINNKTFSRDSEIDTSQHFSKHEFSLFIRKNYKSIDFKSFIPLLNSINKIVGSHK